MLNNRPANGVESEEETSIWSSIIVTRSWNNSSTCNTSVSSNANWRSSYLQSRDCWRICCSGRQQWLGKLVRTLRRLGQELVIQCRPKQELAFASWMRWNTTGLGLRHLEPNHDLHWQQEHHLRELPTVVSCGRLLRDVVN